MYDNKAIPPFQRGKMHVFQTPEHSLLRWAVNKIDHFHINSGHMINSGIAFVAKRVLALAVPIFASLDILQFTGKTLAYAVTLQGDKAKTCLRRLRKSIQLLLCSIPATPIALYSPKFIYENKRGWAKVMTMSVEKDIKTLYTNSIGNNNDPKTALKDALKIISNKVIVNEKAKINIDKMIELIIKEIPSDPDKQEIIIEQYTEFFANLITQAFYSNTPLHQEDEAFIQFIDQLIKLRKPVVRLELTQNLLELFQKENELYNKWKESQKEKKNNDLAIPAVLAIQITKNVEVINRLESILNNPYFTRDKDKLNQMIETLHTLNTSALSKLQKEEMLKKVITCFEVDQTNKTTLKTIHDKRLALTALKRKQEEPTDTSKKDKLQERLKKTKLELDKVTDEKKRKKIEFSIRQMEDGLKKIDAPNDVIDTTGLETEIQDLEASIKGNAKEFGNFSDGQKNLHLLLSIKNKKLIFECLEKIGEGKSYELLSDPEIINFLFTKTFGYENLTEEQIVEIQNLRSPGALVTFYSRLQELSGNERKKAIATSNEVMQAILNGTLNELRHNPQNNPHLEKVYTSRKNLQSDWTKNCKTSLNDLLKDNPQKYNNYNVIEAIDPTDILTIGIDMPSCVHLHGRVQKVKGLLGYIRDGKTHSILVKDNNGQTCAETQLQLMWDSENKKPVLLLGSIYYQGSEKQDHTLYNAVLEFAKRRAKELDLDLVTLKKSSFKEKYSGVVKSLGSSSPLEYVDFLHKSNNGKYTINKELYCIPSADEPVATV